MFTCDYCQSHLSPVIYTGAHEYTSPSYNLATKELISDMLVKILQLNQYTDKMILMRNSHGLKHKAVGYIFKHITFNLYFIIKILT